MRCAKSCQDIESPDDYKDNSDYYEEFLEKYVEKWGEQTDEDYDIIHLYWYNIVFDYLDESILDISVNEMRESLVWYFKRSSEDKAKDIKVTQEQYRKQKEINKELVDENESLKGIVLGNEEEISDLEKSCDETQELLDKQIEATYKLDKENAELKEELKKWKDEWHYVKDGIFPTYSNRVLVFTDEGVGFGIYGLDDKKWHTYDTGFEVIAWKEIVLPELKEIE